MHNFNYRLFHERKSSFFLERSETRPKARTRLTCCYLTCWFVYDKLSFSFSSSWSRVPVKVLRQMYAHIYGRKHAEYLCPFANTLNDKSLWPNHLISFDLRKERWFKERSENFNSSYFIFHSFIVVSIEIFHISRNSPNFFFVITQKRFRSILFFLSSFKSLY